MRMARLFHLALASAVAGSAALASPITYTMTATASGTLGGTVFTNAAIKVTSLADTSQVFVASIIPDPNYQVFTANSSITIAGFPPAAFTDQTFWVDPNDSGDIIFGDSGSSGGPFGGILGFTALFSGLESYNLKSSFGPVFSPFDFETSVFNAFRNIPTSEGSLSLVASNDTFTAVSATPEPASLLIAGWALWGVLALAARTSR